MTRATQRQVVIRASAGTGKTYQLSNRFISLLAADVPPEQILATTFTRKAAGEILDRVLLRLATAAASDAGAAELATAIRLPGLRRVAARQLLVKTVRALHRLRVGTLDSHFLQVAGGFSLELGLPAGWSICEPLDDERIRDEAIEQVLAQGRLAELLTLVHLLAKGDAVRSISRIVRDTVKQLFDLYRETEPAAWEQIPAPAGLPAAEVAETIAAIAAFSLPGSRLPDTRDKDVAAASEANWDRFISAGIGKNVLAGEVKFGNQALPAELIALYQKLLREAEAVLMGEVARQTEATYRLLSRFAGHYHALQAARRGLRFADVTQRLAAATSLGSPDDQAFRLDSPIKHLLLDEFQDTAPVQWQVLRPLAQQVAQGGGRSFFCVGDTKQAIYGWRGGLAEIFDALADELPPLDQQQLSRSYRSSQPVIDAVNQVFTNLTNHPSLDQLAEPVAAWQRAFPKHETAKAELSGCVRLQFAPPARDGEDQAELVWDFAAERVKEHAQSAPRASIGVLVRTNNAVARMIYLLRQKGVAASEEGGNPLVDSPAVELLLSLLKLADHPADSAARFHLAKSPLAERLELTDHADTRAAARLARHLRRELLEEGYGPVVFRWARELAPACDARDQNRLQQLVELAYEYQPASTLRTSDFLALVESQRIADPTAAAVRVMTIHQAKGLEFDVVVLPELEAKLGGEPEAFVVGRPSPTQPINVVCRYANQHVRQFFPPRLARLFEEETSRSVAEALCVLYVAMTRAVHCLDMILLPPPENEKKLRATFSGLLRATLGPPAGPKSGLLYQHGDASWFAKLPPASAPPTPAASLPARILFAAPAKVRDRGLERTSPSGLEGGERLAVRILLGGRAGSFEHGTLIHAWLEQIAWLDDGPIADDKLLAVAQRYAPRISADPADLARRLAEFRRQIAPPAVAAALSRAAYAKLGDVSLAVQTERSFAIRDDDKILTGNIDRLVVASSGGMPVWAEVLDFKTDTLSPDDAKQLAAKVEYYRPQIAAYRRAAARLTGLAPSQISAKLIFLSLGMVREL
ncbi:MAG: UvrD-helicase domain-containing protein [Pirellulaceae bacterium]|nr:UvrD-helicase domain-containing protein [Pirellulaceae bacterium]